MDYRIEKTKKSIYNAFIELRSKKPLEKLTVKELCEAAQINKSTFYTHYKDVYDLSDQIESEIVSSVINNIENADIFFEDPNRFTEQLFLGYNSMHTLISTVFSGIRSEQLPKKIVEKLKQILFTKYPELINDPEKNIILTYSVYGGYYAYYKEFEKFGIKETVRIISKVSESCTELMH